MTGAGVTRRAALLAGGAGLLAAGAWASLGGTRFDAEALIAAAGDREALKALGRRAMETPAGRGAQLWLTERFGGTADLASAFADSVAADRREGRLLDVDGWRLPETLVRTAALAAAREPG